MSAGIKIANSILCEYVADGNNNKHTLVNVFSGDVLVKAFPVQLSFGFYFEIFVDNLYSGPINIQIMLGKRAALSGVSNVEISAGGPAVIALSSAVFSIDAPTTLRVNLKLEGKRFIRAMEKKIELNQAILTNA